MSTQNTKTTQKTRAAKLATGAVDAAKAQLAKAAETHLKAADDAAQFGKSNVEAVIEAGSAWFQGMEEMTRGLVGLTQAQVDAGMSAAKAILAAKTMEEFAELQNGYAKTAFDTAVSEATKLSEIALRVASQTAAPLNARLNASIEQFSKTALAA